MPRKLIFAAWMFWMVPMSRACPLLIPAADPAGDEVAGDQGTAAPAIAVSQVDALKSPCRGVMEVDRAVSDQLV